MNLIKLIVLIALALILSFNENISQANGQGIRPKISAGKTSKKKGHF